MINIHFKSNLEKHLKLLHQTAPYRKRLSVGFLVLLITIAISFVYPLALSNFIDKSITGDDVTWFKDVAILMFLLVLVQAVAVSFRFYIFSSTGQMIVRDIRQKLFSSVVRQEIAFFDENKVGELMSRLSADVDVLQDTLSMGLAVMLRSLLTVIGGFIILFSISLKLTLYLFLILPPMILLTKFIGQKISLKYKDIQNQVALCNNLSQESFSNIRLVHTYNKIPTEEIRYKEETDKALFNMLDATRIFAIFQGIGVNIQTLALLIILFFGGGLITSGDLTVGSLTSFVLYSGMISISLMTIFSFWTDWMKAIGATERVFMLLKRKPDYHSNDSTIPTVFSGGAKFHNVSFRYPSRPEALVLENLSFSINKGEKVALVGASGSGKSTIASLLLGLYKPNSGKISYDELESEEISIEEVRNNFGIVEQEPSLFSSTIFENISYGSKDHYPSEESIIEAAKLANAHDFIMKLPEQYNTWLGEKGVQLSGGQKQRVAIARAILRDPKILILDEATSALDSESEMHVQEALKNVMDARTTIIIAHRFSTIVNADKIIVLNQGSIVEVGTHSELLANKNSAYNMLFLKHINLNNTRGC
jgi:ATP-binding cassette subfamily B protein